MKVAVDFTELINANAMTDELWNDVKTFAKEAIKKDWDDYLERSQHFDDAFHVESRYFHNLQDLAENKGFIYQTVLAKEGQVVPCEVVNTKYGHSWIVKTAWGRDGEVVEWVNVSVASTNAKQQAHYAKKGYQLVVAEVRGQLVNGVVKPVWSDVKSVEVL